MQLPIDVKAVVDAAAGIDEARATPVSVSVYLDETAPDDIIAHVRSAFASAAVHARITISYLGGGRFAPNEGDDMAVIVAGLADGVGQAAAQARAAGVPAMVVTTLPDLVREIAEGQGAPIPEGDVVAPAAARGGLLPSAGAAPAEGSAGGAAEPIALDAAAAASLDARMGEWIIEACPEKRLALALAFPFVRRPLSLDAVNVTAVQNAGIGLVVFIPGADMPIMTLNQAKMLLQIAAAYGEPMGAERVKELAAVVGGAFALRTVARNLVGIVPALGWAVKAAIGYTGTVAMGRAAIEYFENGGGIAGLAGTVAHARDAALRVVAEAEGAPAAEPEPAPEPPLRDRAADAAAVWGGRAKGAAAAVAGAAGPLMASAARVGAESFASGVGSMARGAAGKVSSAVRRR